ncbi:MAG: tyrosine--tRNA ligase [Jatrophihabitans sp.]
MTDTSLSVPPADLPAELHEAYQVLAAGTAAILPTNGLEERMVVAHRENRQLRVKLGIDPSGTQLTLGHAVVLRKLRQFQDAGHLAVLVVGGFTGQVGDPSGRSATRVVQTPEQVVANAQGYFDQLMRILDPEHTEVVNNASWLAPMSVADLLGYAREMTVAQLLERDDFARRFKTNIPISLSELFYPMLQGIDSVEIHADIELGGTDQTFNNLVGRELQRSRGQAPQAVMTLPLLVGTDGVEKMGKSLGNFIAIDEPAAEQFGKLMSIPDAAVETYAVLCADYRPAEVEILRTQLAAGGNLANVAKRGMAKRVVDLYHGSNAGEQAEAGFNSLFRDRAVPQDVPEHPLGPEDPVHVPAVLVAGGLAASSSAARRLVDGGGVKVDGVPVSEYDMPRADLVGRVLAAGKRHAVRLT